MDRIFTRILLSLILVLSTALAYPQEDPSYGGQTEYERQLTYQLCQTELNQKFNNECSIIGLQNLSGALLERDQLKAAEALLKQIASIRTTNPDLPFKQALISYYYALLNQKRHNIVDSEKYYEKANHLFERDGAVPDKYYRDSLIGLAGIYDKKGKTFDAQALKTKATEINNRLIECSNLNPNRFQPFLDNLAKKIKQNWALSKFRTSDHTTIFFLLRQDGTIRNLSAYNFIGTKEEEEKAVSAVKKSAPFSNVPLFCDYLPIRLVLPYDQR